MASIDNKISSQKDSHISSIQTGGNTGEAPQVDQIIQQQVNPDISSIKAGQEEVDNQTERT